MLPSSCTNSDFGLAQDQAACHTLQQFGMRCSQAFENQANQQVRKEGVDKIRQELATKADKISFLRIEYFVTHRGGHQDVL